MGLSYLLGWACNEKFFRALILFYFGHNFEIKF